MLDVEPVLSVYSFRTVPNFFGSGRPAGSIGVGVSSGFALNLPPREVEEVRALGSEYGAVFVVSSLDMRRPDVVQDSANTGHAGPLKGLTEFLTARDLK